MIVDIAIIDADLIGRKNHRFPNLACEKLSAYWKKRGAFVKLKTDYVDLNLYDHVYISKVFTDTPIPEWLRATKKVHLGGTGFYFDKAPNLPDEVEHCMPDYQLYNTWIEQEVTRAKTEYQSKGKSFNEKIYRRQFREYTDYCIGFLTRGCFRKCDFCVNKKYDHVYFHSPLDEFYDEERKKICLLDDNFLGYPKWETELQKIIATNKPYKFKQGLDERLLTEKKCELLFSSNYDGDYTFAFDNIADYDLIHSKLEMIREYSVTKNIKFYILVGFESIDYMDIENAFKRVALLMQYKCLPYIMRYQNLNDTPWKRSKYKGLYITMARWCNQPSIFKKMSFRYFCEANQALHKTEGTLCSSMRALEEFEKDHPDIAAKYFDLNYEDM